MKTLKVTSKSKADSLMVNSLFTAGATLIRAEYCSGKYKPRSFPVGRELEVNEDIIAIWSEARKDQDGAYCTLYCLYPSKVLVNA